MRDHDQPIPRVNLDIHDLFARPVAPFPRPRVRDEKNSIFQFNKNMAEGFSFMALCAFTFHNLNLFNALFMVKLGYSWNTLFNFYMGYALTVEISTILLIGYNKSHYPREAGELHGLYLVAKSMLLGFCALTIGQTGLIYLPAILLMGKLGEIQTSRMPRDMYNDPTYFICWVILIPFIAHIFQVMLYILYANMLYYTTFQPLQYIFVLLIGISRLLAYIMGTCVLLGYKADTLVFLPTRSTPSELDHFSASDRNLIWALAAFLITAPSLWLPLYLYGVWPCLLNIYAAFTSIHTLLSSVFMLCASPVISLSEIILFQTIFYRYCVSEGLCPKDYKDMTFGHQCCFSILSGVLFVGAHLSLAGSLHPIVWLYYFSAGAGYTMLTLLSGSLHLALCLHAFNRLSFLFSSTYVLFWKTLGYPWVYYIAPIASQSTRYGLISRLEYYYLGPPEPRPEHIAEDAAENAINNPQ